MYLGDWSDPNTKTDREAGTSRVTTLAEDEETVTGGLQTVGLMIIKPSDGLELGVCGPVIESKEVVVDGVVGAVGLTPDNGEGGLAVMVGEEEVAGGGGVAPGAAHGAAPE
jgi:hypothetical protein